MAFGPAILEVDCSISMQKTVGRPMGELTALARRVRRSNFNDP